MNLKIKLVLFGKLKGTLHFIQNNLFESLHSYYLQILSKIKHLEKDMLVLTAYRFGFNGQERDDEVSGVGNIMTAEFWEYDARLGRRFNVDPKPISSISAYACFNNNPILFVDVKGDSSVIDQFGNVLYTDEKDKQVFLFHQDKLNHIGDIGDELDLTVVIDNILYVNKTLAKDVNSFSDFYDLVAGGHMWDYKARTSTIFGLVWQSDLKEDTEAEHTELKWHNYKFKDASAFGNFHFGYVGNNIYGGEGLNSWTLHYFAGLAEIGKTLVSDKDIFEGLKLFLKQQYGLPPLGDQEDDYIDIERGIYTSKKEKDAKK